MRRLLVRLVLAGSLAAASLPAFADDCQLKEFASLPSDYGAGGLITLDVVIDDRPAKLVLDTGSDFSFLFQGFVDRVGLAQHDTVNFAYGLTGKPIHKIVRVDRMTLGRGVISNEVFGVANVPSDGADRQPVGIFGAGYLANFDVELDPTSGRVNLFEPKHCPGKVVYWAKEYFRLPVHFDGKRLETQVTLDGKPVRAVIDTGAGVTTLRLAVARSRFGIETPDAAATGRQLKLHGLEGAPLDTFPHVFHTLTLGDITLNDTNVIIADIDSGRGAEQTGSHIVGIPDQPDMLIGLPLLRRLHLFIAYSEEAIYFTIADPPPAAAK
jgi:Aspartyl protease